MIAIRTHLLLLAALALGCSRGQSPEPAPVPEPAPPVQPPPPALLAGIPHDPPFVCIVRNGRLEEVEIEYNPQRGDSTYQSRPFSAAFPTDSTYALNAAWYRDNEPIAFARGRYVKYGLPRILGTTDVVPFGDFQGVTVFAEPTMNRDRPEVIYIPVRPGCEFQPYIGSWVK